MATRDYYADDDEDATLLGRVGQRLGGGSSNSNVVHSVVEGVPRQDPTRTSKPNSNQRQQQHHQQQQQQRPHSGATITHTHTHTDQTTVTIDDPEAAYRYVSSISRQLTISLWRYMKSSYEGTF